MKILFLTNHFLPRIGGIEIATHNLAEALTDLGHSITVFAPRLKKGEKEIKTNYRIIRRPLYPPKVPTHWRKAFWLALEKLMGRVDIIHAQVLYRPGYEATWFGNLFNVPVIVSPQGSDIHTDAERGEGLLLNEKQGHYIRQTLQKADAVTYAGRFTLDNLLSLGCAEHKCFFLPNGTNRRSFQGLEKLACRRELQLPLDQIIVTTIGRNHPVKGLDIFVESIGRLPEEGTDFHAVIAGSGTGDLAPAIERKSVTSRVTLMPDIPMERDGKGVPVFPSATVARLLVASDIYVAPALYGGFELSSADALAAGLPTVIGDRNGSSDIIKEHGAGLVVRSGDADAFSQAIGGLIKDEGLRTKMSQGALETSSLLDWSAIAERSEQLYRSVMSRVN